MPPTPRLPSGPRTGPKAGPRAGPRAPAVRRSPLPFQDTRIPDPLAEMQAPDDDIEAQSAEALDLTQQAFRDREKALSAEIKDYRPIEFFRVLVFATPAQSQAFAAAVGEDVHQQYMDGRKICAQIGIEIPADVWRPKKSLASPSKRLAAIAMPLPPKKSPGK